MIRVCSYYIHVHVQDGRTALFIASWMGHGEIVQLLLQKHADPHISKKVPRLYNGTTSYIQCHIEQQKSFNIDVGMHHAKNRRNKEIPLSNTIKDTSTIMRNPLPELCREGYA